MEKMFKRKYILLSLVIICLSTLYCRKEQNLDPKSGSPLNLVDFSAKSSADFEESLEEFFTNTDKDGDLYIQETHSINNVSSGHIEVTLGSTLENIDELDINNGDINLSPVDNGFFIYSSLSQSGIYGTMSVISISKEDTIVFNDSLYIPSRMNATFNDSIVEPGDNVFWNSDADNDLGVAFAVQYIPEISATFGFEHSGSERITNYTLEDDDGSLTIGSSMFDDIPDNSYVTLYIGRGNWKNSPTIDEEKSLNILSFSIATCTIIYLGD